ncbi:hypothetical protein F5Y03DRAFT_121617 [Xylaria venustula]|nr:hypothetical protein F5Y03DRAFT_121617 [Xylaria venustula]
MCYRPFTVGSYESRVPYTATTSFGEFHWIMLFMGINSDTERCLRHIHEYVDQFNVKSHVHLNTMVLRCVLNTDNIRNVGKSNRQNDDMILAPTGSRTNPLIQAFKGKGLVKGAKLAQLLYGLLSDNLNIPFSILGKLIQVYIILRTYGCLVPALKLFMPLFYMCRRWVEGNSSTS